MQVKQAHITGAIINNKNRVKLSITVGRLLGMSKLTDERPHMEFAYIGYNIYFWMRATTTITCVFQVTAAATGATVYDDAQRKQQK